MLLEFGICIFEGFLDASMNIINITNLAATTFRYSMELRIEKITKPTGFSDCSEIGTAVCSE